MWGISGVDVGGTGEPLRVGKQGVDTEPLPRELQKMVDEELEVLERVKTATAAVRSAKKQPKSLPDLRAPYFGRLRLLSRGRLRDVLLGWGTFINSRVGVTIVDWRSAPLAGVFFTYRQGEEYEEELDDGRLLEGTIRQRRLLSFREGELVSIDAPEGFVMRDVGERWRVASRADAPRIGDGGDEHPFVELPPPFRFSVEMLDEVQRSVVSRDAPIMLVLGDAGCGKTLVAVFRLARWIRDDPKVDASRDVIVIVPEDGLCLLIRRMLDMLELPEVCVLTFDEWVVARAREALPGIPARLSPDTPLAVERFKRHPAFRSVIPDFVEAHGRSIANRVDWNLGARGEVREIYDSATGESLVDRLRETERRTQEIRDRLISPEVTAVFKQELIELSRIHRILPDLVGDGIWLSKAIARSAGALTPAMAVRVRHHLRRQMDMTTEELFADIVDQSRLTALDGQPLDWGTPDAAASTLDVADHALLLELLARIEGSRAKGRGGLEKYHHLVVDEAQDLAPIELSLLGRAVSDEGCLTVAGDRSQHIDQAACFSSWRDTLVELDVRSVESVLLSTIYRCPKPVAELGRSVLGAGAPRHGLDAPREALPVILEDYPTAGHQMVYFIEALARLRQREPRASIAMVTRRADSAKPLRDALERGLAANLVLDGSFSFGPGIEVTDVSRVKGLEFDYVIIPDVSSVSYPDTPIDRRTLYVAITRARRQLWMSWVGKPSPLIKHALEYQIRASS